MCRIQRFCHSSEKPTTGKNGLNMVKRLLLLFVQQIEGVPFVLPTTSVTRFGDFLDFGQLLKPLGTITLPKSCTFLGNFCKGVIIYHFSSEIIFWQLFLDIWQFFSGHTGNKHCVNCATTTALFLAFCYLIEEFCRYENVWWCKSSNFGICC